MSGRGTWILAGLCAVLAAFVLAILPLLGEHAVTGGRDLERGSAASDATAGVVEQARETLDGREAVALVYRGRVVDSDGAPLEGARVELGAAFALSSADGSFRCASASAASVVRVSSEGYETLVATVAELTSADAGGVDLGVLTLLAFDAATLRLDGRVVDADGEPLSDVDVRFGLRVAADDSPLESCLQRVFLGSDAASHQSGSVRSRADGSFTLPAQSVRAGLTVWASSPDLGQAGELTLTDPEPGAFLLLRLERRRALAGRVVDPSGRGVADAPVCAAAFGEDLTRAPSFSSRWVRTTTAEDGAFELLGVPSGPLSIGVGAEALQIFRVAALTDEDVLLELSGGRDVAGQLVDAQSKAPVAGGTVSAIVTALAGDRVTSFEAVSDASGRFELGGMPRAGTVHLIVRHADYAVAGTRLPGSSLWTGREASAELFDEPLTVEMQRGARLTVELVSQDGVPFAGAAVAVSGHGGLVRASATTDAAGHARFEHLNPGMYVAEVPSEGASAGAGLDPQSARIHVDDDEERHTLELVRGVLVRGRLVDLSGAPLAGGQLTLGLQPPGEAVFTAERTAHADREGLFELRSVPAGSAFVLDALHPDRLRASLAGQIPTDLTEHDLGDLPLIGMAAIEGLVLTTEGAPVAGAELHIVRSTGPPSPIADALSGADGRFRITDVEAGPLVVIARKDGHYATRIQRLDPVPGTTTGAVSLTLAEGRTHAGHVTDRRFRPFAGATVVAHWAPTYEEEEGEGIGVSALRKLLAFNRVSTTSSADGTFVLTGVPPDQPVEFSAFAEGFQSDPVSFSPFFVGVESDVHIVLGKLAQ